MFAERFDALMNIAEVSNSQLGRDIGLNPSHIGRLRSGARSLPKKHDYLPSICRYLAGHIRKDYQINALQKLVGLSEEQLGHAEERLEQWLLEDAPDTRGATGQMIAGFSRIASGHSQALSFGAAEAPSKKITSCYYGNAGKRKAVEQFFLRILQETKPQTLLLYSDENMAWLYEDPAFAARWAELFLKVIQKGNRVRIIHTIARDMNELLQAVTKWLPIYMTGAIEPYYYPRLRDGLFRHTFFLAPRTAAIYASSVYEDTAGMLNLFLTDQAAIQALAAEYQVYFTHCRPPDADLHPGPAGKLCSHPQESGSGRWARSPYL